MLCDVGRLECAPHSPCFGVNAKAAAVLILDTDTRSAPPLTELPLRVISQRVAKDRGAHCENTRSVLRKS